MASIRKLPSGKYYCQFRLKGSKPSYKSFSRIEDAKRWVEQKEKAHQNEESTIKFTSEDTLSDIGIRYCSIVLKGKASQYQTLMRIERMAKHFPQPFNRISKWDVNDYRLARLKAVSSTTCRDELVLLSRLFRWINRELLLELVNPCTDIALPRASKPRDKVVSPEEMELLLKAMSPRMAVIIELAYETAMRRSEILKLTPSCLNLDKRLLDVIDGKTGSRTVPLTRRAVELLSRAEKACPRSDSRIFPASPYGVSQALRRARIKLGLSDDIRVHQLRHSRISIVARKGFNNSQIMAVSGHRDVRSVQRYTHLNALDVVDLLE